MSSMRLFPMHVPAQNGAQVTPPKPEPVETAEEFAPCPICDRVDDHAHEFLDMLSDEAKARDAALVADAEARGAMKALDEFERLCRGGHLHGEARAMFERLRVKYTKGGADGG